MKKLVLMVSAIAILVGCGAPAYYEREEPKEDALVFSQDPLLDSVYRAQYLEMLRRCGSGKDECRK